MNEDKNIKLEITSTDFWVKIVDFLQQNWALIESQRDNKTVIVYFIHDGSTIFDEMEFESIEKAEKGLLRNGFKKYLDETENFTAFMFPPKKPFDIAKRSIYSSGEFWTK